MTFFRWREAFDARKDDNDAIVPRYVLMMCCRDGMEHRLANHDNDTESS